MKKQFKIKLVDLLKKEYANMGGMSKSNHLGGGKFPTSSAPMEPLDHMTNKLRKKDEDELEEASPLVVQLATFAATVVLRLFGGLIFNFVENLYDYLKSEGELLGRVLFDKDIKELLALSKNKVFLDQAKDLIIKNGGFEWMRYSHYPVAREFMKLPEFQKSINKLTKNLSQKEKSKVEDKLLTFFTNAIRSKKFQIGMKKLYKELEPLEEVEESKVSDFFKKVKRMPSDIRTANQAIEAAKKGDLQGVKVGVNTLTNHLSGNEKKKREKELYTVFANAVKTKNPHMFTILNKMNEVEESRIGTNFFSGRETDYHSFKGSSKKTYGKTNFSPSNSGQPDIDDDEEKGYLENKTKVRSLNNVIKKRK
jgi:hypothetical protein